jgi:hypothetical protein
MADRTRETRMFTRLLCGALALSLAACASSGGQKRPKANLEPARAALAAAKQAGAEERAADLFTRAQGHLNEAEALAGPKGPDGAEGNQQAETLARIATTEANCATEIARLSDPQSPEKRSAAAATVETERLQTRLRKADDELRRLEDRVTLLQHDLEMTETEVIRTKARLKGNETKAEASSAIAEARILMKRLSADKSHGAALTRCNELLLRAEDLLRAENYGAAAFFALKAQETATKTEGAAAPANPAGLEHAPAQRSYLVKATLANLRKGPAPNEAVAGTLPKGAALEALAMRGEWIKVRSGSLTGWIHKSLVE